MKYYAHINIEQCNQSTSIKYLFRYVNKGNDCVIATFSDKTSDNVDQQNNDEIKGYYDCRYISPFEVVWRIFGFNIQYKDALVERLPFHCLKDHTIVYYDDDLIDEIIN